MFKAYIIQIVETGIEFAIQRLQKKEKERGQHLERFLILGDMSRHKSVYVVGHECLPAYSKRRKFFALQFKKPRRYHETTAYGDLFRLMSKIFRGVDPAFSLP